VQRALRRFAEPLDSGYIGPHAYNADGLICLHNHDFMLDDAFLRVYERGVQAAGSDYNWHWRVHIGLWAARTAVRVPGDFVECGVNKGFLSSCIMQALDWDALGRRFFLLDTFKGIDERYVSARERKSGVLDRNRRFIDTGFYGTVLDDVRRNFAQWRNVVIVEGTVPATLAQVDADRVAFLHVDLNNSPPEVAAVEHFWERLSPGGILLLDDYAYWGYEPQKAGMDVLASKLDFEIASLPTGQGLVVKPPGRP
jgi:SAM-dependent methyltransferase